jgi:hypothetical protein
MSETPGCYTRDDGSPLNKQKSSAELAAQSLVGKSAISTILNALKP